MLQGKRIVLSTYGMSRTERPAQEDVRVDCRPIANPIWRTPAQRESAVLGAPGFPVVLGLAMENILKACRTTDTLSVGVCCSWGRHRSPAVATVLRTVLLALGAEVPVIKHLSEETDASIATKMAAPHMAVPSMPSAASGGRLGL